MPTFNHRSRAFCALGLLLTALALSLPGPAQSTLPFDWQQSNGPQGGQIFDIAKAPNGDIYAGCWRGAGIFRSTDQGVSWVEVGLRGETIHEIVTTNDGTIFVGVSGGEVFRSQDDGATWPLSGSGLVSSMGALAYDGVLDYVYAAKSDVFSRSTDEGDSWQPIDTNFPAVSINALAAIPNGGPIYAGTNTDKVYRSLDGGATWSLFDAGMTTNRIDAFLIGPPDDFYAASYGGGVYHTTYDGSAWTQISTGLSDLFCLAIARDQAGRLWVGTASSGSFVSDDSGANWSPAATGLEGQEIRSLEALGEDEILAGSYGGGVHRTTDAGVSWLPSNEGMFAADVSALTLAAGGTVYAVTHGAGVARSLDDGDSWSPINAGIEDFDLFDIVIHPDGDLFVGGWRTQIYRSQNGGDSWTRSDTGLSVSRVGCLAVKDSGDLFAGGYFGGGVWRSTNKGDSWFAANSGMTDGDTEDILVRENGDLLAATRGGGVFLSTNNGDTWTPLSNGLTNLNITRLLETASKALFAATDAGLFRSLNDGALWELVDASLPATSLGAIAVNPSGHLFAGLISGGGLYRSLDTGDSWQYIADGFPDVFIRSFGFDSSGRLLAGTGGLGVIHTVQSTPVFLADLAAERLTTGAVVVRWKVQAGAHPWRFDVFRGVESGRRIQLTREAVGGGPDCVYVDADAPVTASAYWLHDAAAGAESGWFGPARAEAFGASGLGLRLETTRPNPVATSATIGFSLPGNGSARLSVFDLRGRLVRRLALDPAVAGFQETDWDVHDERGNPVAAGSYLLRLEATGRVVTRKILVIDGAR